MAVCGDSFGDSPCRFAALRGDQVEGDLELIELPPCEQVSRGQELLQLLQPPFVVPAQAALAGPVAEAAGAGPGVKMVVRRTFIELVEPPCRRQRSRALSDSMLTHELPGDDRQWQFCTAAEPVAELSEASTDAPSDPEDMPLPVCWHHDQEAGYWLQQPEAVGLPTVMMPPSPMGDAAFASAACMAPVMTSDMWMAAGFDRPDMLPYHPMQHDVYSPWQWAPMDPCAAVPEEPTAAGSGSPRAGRQARGKPAGEVAAARPKTTVLLRNVPSTFTRAALLELLEDEGFEGTYDFVYMPMDFGSKVCLGYAFVNFASHCDAQRCWEIFDGLSDWGQPNDRACEVTWGEPCQGLEAHVERYRNSPVMHESIPEEWKPAIFKHGARVPFPAPTKSIQAPKLRRRATAKEDHH
mmetsp:Transcript_70132/g.226980  ORF Transcript_70132/g.226980 Transcript_70132/m.226980 type:complete len:409 (+) Transcript_70132:78-1304(+)